MSGAYPTYTMADVIKGRKLQTIDNTVSIYEIMQSSNGDRIFDSRESDMLETDYRYVLKTLKRGKEDEDEIRDDNYQRNAYLEAETRILSNMSHPNIIRLEGISHEVDSFIILERLWDTLAYRIQQWHVEDCKIGVTMYRKKKLDKLQETKLHVAYDITTAIEHLHKHNIVHRDIKPENFQFDDVSPQFLTHSAD
jgi:serine/threonine protein kinase